MNFQDILLVSVIGYIVGSIQPSYFIGKIRGIDIREHGSKNAGAANTTMILGWTLGLSTGIFDVLKATFCVILTANIFNSPDFSFLPFLSGAMAIIGHNYPFYMGFDGGKGTASVIGIMLGFDPMWGLVMLAVIISSTIITNYLVVGTINIYLMLMYLAIFKYTSPEILYVSLFLSILGIYKHRQNIVRIKNRTEPTFRSNL
jgi:glycerol-3-phosphate acyltransferase PlsY